MNQTRTPPPSPSQSQNLPNHMEQSIMDSPPYPMMKRPVRALSHEDDLFMSDEEEITKLWSNVPNMMDNGLSYYDNQSTPSDIEMREFIIIGNDTQ